MSQWYHEDEHCWIAECESCAVPMVVWKSHGLDPEHHVREHMLDTLARVVRQNFTWEHRFDDNMRSIPDHFHVHARPKNGFYGHGLK